LKSLLSIQYLRALAALAVVLSHTTPFALIGQAGVDVFFVVSGFIMWTSTNRPTTPALFFWHRLIRIAPLYWIATLIMALHQAAPTESVIRSMLFQPYFGAGGHIWPVLVAGWTLSYEMLFYVLMGLVLTMPRRNGLPVLAAALCLLAIANVFVPSSDPVLLTFTNPLILEFLAGAALAELRLRNGLPGSAAGLLLLGGGIIALYVQTWPQIPVFWRFTWWGVPSAMIVTGAVALEAAGKVTRFVPLLAIGDASYSIYLFHPFILKTTGSIFAVEHLPLRCAIALLACSALGLLIYYAVERPITNWLRAIRFRGAVDWRSLARIWQDAALPRRIARAIRLPG
jgi:exopolysaccharide production protein ExoZ